MSCRAAWPCRFCAAHVSGPPPHMGRAPFCPPAALLGFPPFSPRLPWGDLSPRVTERGSRPANFSYGQQRAGYRAGKKTPRARNAPRPFFFDWPWGVAASIFLRQRFHRAAPLLFAAFHDIVFDLAHQLGHQFHDAAGRIGVFGAEQPHPFAV